MFSSIIVFATILEADNASMAWVSLFVLSNLGKQNYSKTTIHVIDAIVVYSSIPQDLLVLINVLILRLDMPLLILISLHSTSRQQYLSKPVSVHLLFLFSL